MMIHPPPPRPLTARARPAHAAGLLSVLLLIGLPLAGNLAAQSAPPASPTPQADAVRLLWSPGQIAEGRSQVEALPIDPEVRKLVFLIDGEEVETRGKPPWRVRLRFAEPAREQTLTVRALGPRDRVLGEDSMQINRFRRPFRVFLDPLDGPEVTGEVSVPRGAALKTVRVEIDGAWVDGVRVGGGESDAADPSGRERFIVSLGAPLADSQIVRAVATLEDGREIENAGVVGAENSSARVDVRLVQIQTLVTDRNGRPLTDLEAGDFEILEDGQPRQIDRVRRADDVSLALGLVVDSSQSMDVLWPVVETSSAAFLNTVVGEGDEVFLVDFASQIRLLEPFTADRARINSALAEVRPEGMTALYDSIVYSMLQFGDQPGRRALVVITDGADFGSQADPERAVEIGGKLGIPVYVVFLQNPRQNALIRDNRQRFAVGGGLQEMKLLTEPTGGRLLRVGGGRSPGGEEGLLRAFRRIADELRSQHLITYYTDKPLADLDGREVEVRVKNRDRVEVRSVLAWDQIQ